MSILEIAETSSRQCKTTVVAPEMLERTRLWSIGALSVAIVFWGANWPIMKAALAHSSPLWFSAIRFLSGAVCLFIFEAARGDLRIPATTDLPFIASIGLLQMMAFTALGALAMTHMSAGRSAILSYTTLLWVVPASVLIFKQRMNFRSVVGVVVAAAGVVFLVDPIALVHRGGSFLPSVMLLGASLCWAICILHLRHFKSSSSAYALAPWQMLLAGMILALAALITEGPLPGDGTLVFWSSVGFVGPVATAFCFCAVNAASTWLPATGMSLAMLGVPLTGVAISAVTLGEQLTPDLIGGCVAIALGIILQLKPNLKGK